MHDEDDMESGLLTKGRADMKSEEQILFTQNRPRLTGKLRCSGLYDGSFDTYVRSRMPSVEFANYEVRREKKKRPCCSIFKLRPGISRSAAGPIISYSTDSLTGMGIFFTTGTVFASRFIWGQFLFLGSIAFGVFALGRSFPEFNSDNVLPSLERTTTLVNTLCTFLLSLFVSITMARWWSIRQAYQRFLTTSLDLASAVNCCNTLMVGKAWVHQPYSDEQPEDVGSTLRSGPRGHRSTRSRIQMDQQQAVLDAVGILNRYILLSHALIYREAAAHPTVPKSLREAIDLEALAAADCRLLLRGEELDALAALPPNASKAQAVWVWILMLVVDICANQRLMVDGVAFEMRGFARAANAQIQELFTYLDTQLPLAYVHVISVIVKFNMLLFALHTGVAAAAPPRFKRGDSTEPVPVNNSSSVNESGGNIAIEIPANVVAMLAVCVIFQGCLELHRKLRNPFFGDTASFPETVFHEKLQDQLRATSHVAGHGYWQTSHRTFRSSNDSSARSASAPAMSGNSNTASDEDFFTGDLRADADTLERKANGTTAAGVVPVVRVKPWERVATEEPGKQPSVRSQSGIN
jgi:hypothetical protein